MGSKTETEPQCPTGTATLTTTTAAADSPPVATRALEDHTLSGSAPSERLPDTDTTSTSSTREKLIEAVIKSVGLTGNSSQRFTLLRDIRSRLNITVTFNHLRQIGSTSRDAAHQSRAMNRLVDENVWIGGFHALNQTDAFQKANITHVVTALRINAPEKFAPYVHHLIQVDDVNDEDLLRYFPKSNAFIKEALATGGGVFVHCAMGISRSATILAAYLMWSRKIPAMDALKIIEGIRPIVCPNLGFRKQLELFEDMGWPDNVEDHPMYQRWLFKQEVELSNCVGKAPSTIRFEDEKKELPIPVAGIEDKAGLELRCKRCRHTLATSHVFAPHIARLDASGKGKQKPCAHHFLEPLLWMKPELSKGAVSGKLECPKCSSKIGSYAWQGLQCSCGNWTVPGISIARGKVDEVKVSHL